MNILLQLTGDKKAISNEMRRIVKEEKSQGTPLLYHMREIGFLESEATWWSQIIREIFLKSGNKEKKSCHLSVTKDKKFLISFLNKQLQVKG